ncbi:hypothetical protein HDU98_010588 [Podochytrium sp. JEL0797]|nr:hypothetical protein HDU98_010588 [Podochytrium sp. JEL0797]
MVDNCVKSLMVPLAKINMSTTEPVSKEASAEIQGEEDSLGMGGWMENMSYLMDLNQLSVALGGHYEYRYQHDVYWPDFIKRVWKE